MTRRKEKKFDEKKKEKKSDEKKKIDEIKKSSRI
jgi:hypothetical protein